MDSSATNPMDLDIKIIPLKKAALVIRALNHTLRQQLLQLIHHSGKTTVTELYIKLRLEQSVASQQLAILRRAGFVQTERQGKFVYYSVNYEAVKEVHNQIEFLLEQR